MRPKAKFLTAVWGEAYIERFANLALPSFIAPGNLPALAEHTDLEVVIMTRSADIAYFERHRAFQSLQSISPVRFVVIDDLITTSAYGVTLTLAYARPIIACGADMLNTHFVFMNADFVLADGSLRSLCAHIVAGRSIVLGPSFRAVAENVEPLLAVAVDPASSVLAMKPRRMAGLSLAHPHATTFAKNRSQGLCHSVRPNQFFWRVDKQTLLARYYLIFMLCLKPERVITSVNSFCDYALIPEMCPSGDEVVMDDSDNFFMLELQQRAQEKELLRLGTQTDSRIAKSLQQWTTAEHRRAANHDILFHAGDIPPATASVRAEAEAFIQRIGRRLRPPLAHASHPYWIRGVEAWKHYRRARNQSHNPAELADPSASAAAQPVVARIRLSFYRRFWAAAYRLHHQLLGQTGFATALNPSWIDQRLLKGELAKLTVDESPLLLVRNHAALVDHLASTGSVVRFFSFHELNRQLAVRQHRLAFHNALVYLIPEEIGELQKILAHCLDSIQNDGTCVVIIHDKFGRINSGQYIKELLELIEMQDGLGDLETEHEFLGSALTLLNHRILGTLRETYDRFGFPALPVIAPVLGMFLPLLLATNFLAGLFPASRNCGRYCSSMVIRLRKTALTKPNPQANGEK